MATNSVFKEVLIDSKRSAASFVGALEKAVNLLDPQPDPTPFFEADAEQVREMFPQEKNEVLDDKE